MQACYAALLEVFKVDAHVGKPSPTEDIVVIASGVRVFKAITFSSF